MKNSASPMFLVTFEGPWVFVVDAKAATITAMAVPCHAHRYVMGDAPNLQAIGQGTYSLADPQAVSSMPGSTLTQLEFARLPRGAAIPDTHDAAHVRCSFQLPLTGLWPMQYALRSRQPADFCDNLLSGWNFRQLIPAREPGTSTCVGLGMALPYALKKGHKPVLKNTEGAVCTPSFDGQGNAWLKIFGSVPGPTPGNDDHCAVTTAGFGLDLHMDGPDVPGAPVLDAPYPRPPQYRQAKTPFIPLLCGGNLVVHG